MAGAREFYLLQDDEAGSGAHSPPFSMKAVNMQRCTSAHPLSFCGVTRNTLNPTPPPPYYIISSFMFCVHIGYSKVRSD